MDTARVAVALSASVRAARLVWESQVALPPFRRRRLFARLRMRQEKSGVVWLRPWAFLRAHDLLVVDEPQRYETVGEMNFFQYFVSAVRHLRSYPALRRHHQVPTVAGVFYRRHPDVARLL